MNRTLAERRTNWVGLLLGWFTLLIVTGVAIGPYVPVEGAGLAIVSGVIAAGPIGALFSQGWI